MAERPDSVAQASGGSLPVDLTHLGRYTMADRALEAEILGLFQMQAPQTIDRLRRSADARQWREASHTLKGSARAIGAWRLAETAQAAEQVEGWRDRAAGEAVLARIEAAFAEIQAFVAALHRSRAA